MTGIHNTSQSGVRFPVSEICSYYGFFIRLRLSCTTCRRDCRRVEIPYRTFKSKPHRAHPSIFEFIPVPSGDLVVYELVMTLKSYMRCVFWQLIFHITSNPPILKNWRWGIRICQKQLGLQVLQQFKTVSLRRPKLYDVQLYSCYSLVYLYAKYSP